MTPLDKLFKLNCLLDGVHIPVPLARISEELECSQSTAQRALKDLGDLFGVPIVHSRKPSGYLFGNKTRRNPGRLFPSEVIQSVLAMHGILRSLQPGLLDSLLAPVRHRLEEILRSQGLDDDNSWRVYLQPAAARPSGPCFDTVATATQQRRRLDIFYNPRGNSSASRREISPQQLRQYRDSWYLISWCHKQNGLRTFSVDRIETAVALDTPADNLDKETMYRLFGNGYGIFSGTASATARLRFTAERARWVSYEEWHHEQTGTFLEGGDYLLEFPYSRSEELILDICRYGRDVVVLDPPDLRQAVVENLRAAVKRYEA